MKKQTFILITATSWALLFAREAAGDNASTTAALRSRIINNAKQYIGTMYNYGGKSEAGFDCSGFVQFIYRGIGIMLPRTAAGQFDGGVKIELAKAAPGDLVFFKIDGEKITHVGIYVSNSEFIHAPSTGGRVSIENMGKEYWKTRYAGAVTYIKKR